MADWQPIDTAPKNGSWILAKGHLPDETPDTLRWDDECWRNGYDSRAQQPTRWAPIPADGVQEVLAPEFKLVGNADFHMSAEMDVCIGAELYIRTRGVMASDGSQPE